MEHDRRIEAARRTIAEAEGRLTRLTTILEERDDPDGTLFAHMQQRLPELAEQIALRQAELTRLQDTRPNSRPEPIGLLDDLPQLEIDLTDLPIEPLRRFLDAFAVEIHYEYRTHSATYRARVSSSAIPRLTDLATVGCSPVSDGPILVAGAARGIAGTHQVLAIEATSDLARDSQQPG